MKNGIKMITVLSLVFGGLLGTSELVNRVSATTVVDCGCGQRACDGRCRLLHRHSKCRSCDTDCGCVQCPSCACDICQLEVKESKVKKTCFKVEQKVICIPPVRFPWQKDCPPMTSKTKTVNVLKKHSYECPSCEYQWSEVKPIDAPTPAIQGAKLNLPGMNTRPASYPIPPAPNAILPPPTYQDLADQHGRFPGK